MFEVAVICIIALAISYWVALFLIGRHDDVLHGDFVHPEQGAAPPPPPPFAFPKRPTARKVPPASKPAAQIESSETLQSLLATIKRDLKDASRL
jgi:hypothetical protein